MNVFDFNLHKTNFLAHSNDYGKKHYQKIDNYYGPGKARYFWSKEEWDAYQREKDALLEKAKADVAKRDAYIRNADYAKNAGADRAAKEKENAQKAVDEQKGNKEKIKANIAKALEKEDYNEVEKLALELPEVKKYIENAKKELKGCSSYQERNEKWMQFNQDHYKDYNLSDYGISTWQEAAIKANIHDKCFEDVNKEIEINILQNEQYKREQDGMYQSALQMGNTDAVYNVVNKKLDDYYNSVWSPSVADTEVIDDYLSDLRSVESSAADLLIGIDKTSEEYKYLSELKIKSSAMSTEEDMKWVNYQRLNRDSWEDGDGNCMLCSLCMDLRARGLDVSAPNSNELDIEGKSYKSGSSATKYKIENRSFLNSGEVNERLVVSEGEGYFELYTDAEKADAYWPARHDGYEPEKVNKYMSKYPNTSGFMNISWKNGGCHAVYYTINDKGKMIIYDAQINKAETYDDLYDHILDCSFVRTDNLTPNYKKLVDKGYIVYD